VVALEAVAFRVPTTAKFPEKLAEVVLREKEVTLPAPSVIVFKFAEAVLFVLIFKSDG
jgi:hypothetical protein